MHSARRAQRSTSSDQPAPGGQGWLACRWTHGEIYGARQFRRVNPPPAPPPPRPPRPAPPPTAPRASAAAVRGTTPGRANYTGARATEYEGDLKGGRSPGTAVERSRLVEDEDEDSLMVDDESVLSLARADDEQEEA